MRRVPWLVIASIGVAAASALGSPAVEPEPQAAASEESGAALTESEAGWTFRFEPLAWYASPGGRVTFAGGDEVETSDLNIDSAGLRPMGQVIAERGRWVFSLSGFALDEEGSLEATETIDLGDFSVMAGDRVTSSLDWSSIQGQASYRVHHYQGQKRQAAGEDDGERQGFNVISTVHLHAGVRLSELDVESRADAGVVDASNIYTEPFAGVDWTLTLHQDVTVRAGASAGWMPFGDTTSGSLEVQASGEWRPARHVGIVFGYRFLRQGLTSEEEGSDFEFDGLAAGLFFGVSLRF